MPHPPSVDQLARSLIDHGLPHPLLVEIAREAIKTGQIERVSDLVEQRKRRMLLPVINGTGVLLHTNLGRAPVGVDQAATYSNLELSLETGRRGSRQQAVGELLAAACGAEAAMVVNNCAAAVLLTLGALGTGRGVAVSRGEMVEIGGGFRIPDVMRQSGARLVEVGTTNRTRVSDYAKAEQDDPDLAMLLKVHRSNYRIVGFTEDAEIADLAKLETPVVADIGSGLLDAACPWLDGPPPSWLADEPAARQTLKSGAALVLFSGDKLFGGPQAGIIAGRRDLVEQCGQHPLARALRPGDLILNALQATALAYLDRRGHDIPFWRMATIEVAELEARANRICEAISVASDPSAPPIPTPTPAPAPTPTPTEAMPGGGTLPTVTFPSFGIRIDADVGEQLRARPRPIVARVDKGATIIDLRTVAPEDDPDIISALDAALDPMTSAAAVTGQTS